MPCPPQSAPASTASIAIGHSRSGMMNSQISGTTEMPDEQTTSTGRAPKASTSRPQTGAEAMRTAAARMPCAATSTKPILRFASMWYEKKPAEIPTAACQASR